MPEELEFYVPVDENQNSFYRLEILFNDRGFPTTFSIYRRYAKRRLKMGQMSIKTYAYCFEYNTAKLYYYSSHLGDFTKPDFRWLETREQEFRGEEITPNHRMYARNAARTVYMSAKYEKEHAPILKEQEKYSRFLSPLEKILGVDKT